MLTHHDSRSYETAASEAAARARGIMEAKIDNGRRSAIALLDRINTQVPQDAITTGRELGFAADGDHLAMQWRDGAPHRIHAHALGQLAERAGVPTQYLRDLTTAVGWQRDLAAHILSRHYGTGEAKTGYLVRSVGDQVRGVLSDKFRRLDSRPLVDAFAGACKAIGAIPSEGVATDVRVVLRAFLPMVFEPVPNEVMCFGVEWSNSDYGAGKHAVRAFVWRLWCTNHATMEDSLAQVHVGGRLHAENIALSQKTYDYDTKTAVSALGDVVTGALAPPKVNLLLEGIRSAHAKKIDWAHAKTALQKRLLKSELKSVEDSFKSADVHNLPEGQSVWRMSNAVSWLARNTDDDARRLELERVAGEVLGAKDRGVDSASGD